MILRFLDSDLTPAHAAVSNMPTDTQQVESSSGYRKSASVLRTEVDLLEVVPHDMPAVEIFSYSRCQLQ